MNRGIIRIWFTIHLALCMAMLYYAITDSVSGKITTTLLIPVFLSTLFICFYRMGMFRKGAFKDERY